MFHPIHIFGVAMGGKGTWNASYAGLHNTKTQAYGAGTTCADHKIRSLIYKAGRICGAQ